MVNKVRFKFNGKLFGKRVYNQVAEEQTKRLIDYAKEEIIRIVATQGFGDRTYNLADSYLWCVFFNGKKKGSGFYGNKRARKKSLLHEYIPDMSIPVDGRKIAKDFVQTYTPSVRNGWEIVFAAVAPYGAYLEEGFTFKGHYYHFNVLSQRYDHIKKALSPLCEVTMEVNTPKY